MRIGVLTNLRAGNSKVAKMLALLQRKPGVFHVETDSSRVLPEALAELLQHQLDILIVNGGDGTVQYTLSELLGSRDIGRLPYIAPLRGGRTNMTARDLGAQPNPLKGLRNVIDAAQTAIQRRLAIQTFRFRRWSRTPRSGAKIVMMIREVDAMPPTRPSVAPV